MKKIGIITIPDYNNYGNRLQNFAVKTFFSQMGYEVDTLELNDTDFSQYQIRKIKLLLKKYKLRPLIYLFEFANGKLKKVKRYKEFQKFTEKYLNVQYHPNGDIEYLKRVSQKYDFIVLGSDQIWHPTVNTTPNLFFATFAEPEKVLFFSPSFGIENLPSDYAERVKRNLANKNNLTVREAAGQKIISELCEKGAVILPDPTLCVKSQDWKNIAVKPEAVENERYVLKYFLGSETAEYKSVFDQICSIYNADIFEIANPDIEFGYTIGPQEFLGSILNADYIVTDSFHAVVFCIMFQKPFTVFSRLNEKGENEGIDSRVDMLLKNFSLQSRKYTEGEKLDTQGFDNQHTEEILTKERQKAIEYFEKVMK